ncbi:MAG TPA: hypothetical protein VK911_09585 [Vicinamibacterales bacterium]|nr:hypothetical protein [Vicinamibacterales bacterium]
MRSRWLVPALVPLSILLLSAPDPLGARGTQAARPASTATDAALRLKGFAEHQALAAGSPFKALAWQFLGPTNISGRCTDVATLTPRGGSYTIYVATASGGLWKTTNEGTVWQPVLDNAPSTSIGDVAVAPSDPAIVWAGTGEANIYRSSQAGIGVYKSVDGGGTWQHMGLADTSTIARIVIHPANPDIVYVAASGREWTTNPERGVYQTADGGRTWRAVLTVDAETGAIDLVMDPADPNTLYAATWQRTRLKWNDPRTLPHHTGSGIHKTTDGGKTWKAITGGLPPPNKRGRIGLDVCLTAPNVLYALVDNYEIAREPTEEEKNDPYGLPSSGFIKGATVYRSDDRGESWTRVSGLTSEQQRLMERHSGTFGWVFGQVRVDPNDPNTVYTLGVRLHVSTDGGRTFSTLDTPGVDHHGLWIDPQNSNYLVSAYDQGLAISYDRGRTWKDSRLTLPAAQFFNVSYDMDTPFRVYGSMQDHGSFRGTVDLSAGRDRIPAAVFEQAPGGEGSTHAINPSDPRVVYSSGFYGTLARSHVPASGTGATRKSLLPARYPEEAPLRGQWLAPTILSPSNPDIVYHGMQYLLRSRDRGDTWDVISPDLTHGQAGERGDISYHTLFTIAESPLRFGLIYVGTDDGRVHVTRDGGGTWTEAASGIPARKWISRIAASAFDLGTVYMTQNGKRDDDFRAYAWKSTDFGRTWRSIAAGIPMGPVNVIREDPVDRNILYVGTDTGVYVSTDAGSTWTVLGQGLPTAYVHDLIIHPRDNVVVAATHGRGMWVLDANAVNKKPERRRRPAE